MSGIDIDTTDSRGDDTDARNRTTNRKKSGRNYAPASTKGHRRAVVREDDGVAVMTGTEDLCFYFLKRTG